MSALPLGRRVVVPALASDPDTAIGSLVLEDQPAPDPAALGPRDVIVAIRAAQVGWVDLLMTSGNYQHQPKPPYTPGLEYAGVVAWRGPDAAGVSVGDRVLVDGFVAGPRTAGPYQAYGGFASYGVAPVDAIRRIPGELSFEQACCLLGNYETAVHALVTRGKLAAGETVLVLGASGATGLAAVHVAKLLGATVIAAGRSADKLAIVKAEGADHVVDTAGDLKAAIRELTKKGVDVVHDGVGGDLSVEALRATRFGARYLIVGWAATPFARDRPNQLPTNLIMMKGVDVLGCPMVISTQHDPSLRAPRLERIERWAAEGRLHPRVGAVFPMDRFRDALRAKWTGAVVGGCVLFDGGAA
jgi:NADPH2:quinone reductase